MKKAMYRRRVIRAGNTVEIIETYPTQFGDGLTRAKRDIVGPGTPDAMKRYNKELAVRRLTRLINENFVPDDLWVTLTYEKETRPQNKQEAKTQLSAFCVKLRKLYAEFNVELKYLKRTALGERGALHHHLIIPQGVPTRRITQLWKEHIGASARAHPPFYVPLYPDGEFSTLAAYIVGQMAEDMEEEKFERKWVGSRNLKKPQEDPPEDIYEIKWQEPPVAWEGYCIDTDSIRAGTNEITGRPYLFYRMVKVEDGYTCRDDSGKLLRGAAAVEYIRRKNAEHIKENWYLINNEGEVVFLEELCRQDE